MKIRREDRDGVTILRLDGKIMGGPDADVFQKSIKDLVAEGRLRLVLDLSKVSWVSSTGLGILISGHTTLQQNGGAMKLIGVNKRIDQIFIVTKLHTIFHTFETEAEALGSF